MRDDGGSAVFFCHDKNEQIMLDVINKSQLPFVLFALLASEKYPSVSSAAANVRRA